MSSPDAPDQYNPDKTIGLAEAADRSCEKQLVNNDPPAFAGRYEILEQLGSGGMSTVYKVKHIHLQKVFALKFLEHSDPESTQRFHQEARASSSLNHPNIVRVHDFGITSEGRSFMVMDHIHGQSLSELIKSDGPLEPERAMRLFSQICSALAHAHENGVIHRDIKPSNIMILRTEAGIEQAVVLDFGIAKVITNEDKRLLTLTQTGQLFGTPFYMSPEQCQGQAVDARADIYSFGCVMYETLSGKPPHQGENLYHTIHKQITEAPPPFSKELRQSRLVRQMESCILKSMAKLPQHRYDFVLELASELKQIEMGTTGAFGDIRAAFKLLSGRFNAIEHTQAMLRGTLQALIAAALVCAFLLFSLPGQVKEAKRLEALHRTICEKTSMLANTQFNREALLAFYKQSAVEKPLREMEEMTKEFPEENKLVRNMHSATKAAQLASVELAKSYRDRMTSGNFMDIGGTIDTVEESMLKAVQLWAQASRDGGSLVKNCAAKMELNRERAMSLGNVLCFAGGLGILIEITLLLMGAKTFYEIRRRRIEELTAKQIPTPGHQPSAQDLNNPESLRP